MNLCLAEKIGKHSCWCSMSALDRNIILYRLVFILMLGVYCSFQHSKGNPIILLCIMPKTFVCKVPVWFICNIYIYIFSEIAFHAFVTSYWKVIFIFQNMKNTLRFSLYTHSVMSHIMFACTMSTGKIGIPEIFKKNFLGFLFNTNYVIFLQE